MASDAEAWLAIEHGASAVGLVSARPSGPGPIPDELIAEIAAKIPPGVSSFLLTCEQRFLEPQTNTDNTDSVGSVRVRQ